MCTLLSLELNRYVHEGGDEDIRVVISRTKDKSRSVELSRDEAIYLLYFLQGVSSILCIRSENIDSEVKP